MSTAGNESQIPWFNPREMPDSIVEDLATGREELLRDFITFVRQRLESPILLTAGAHWLIIGQRGAGKSFFLRYAQIKVPREFPDGSIRFILLPEELPNVRAPHDLLDEIRRMLRVTQVNDPGRPAMWRTENPESFWKESLEKLLAAFPEPLLVVGIENFGELLKKAFDDDATASLLRKLMEHEPRILFLATAVDSRFDDDYGKRLYRQFEKHPLTSWDGQQHREYLIERAHLLAQERKPTKRQQARIDAYSRYTGGNPRIAAILAAAILDEQDIIGACDDLNATIDRMSDYYRTQLRELPENTVILFDALIRGGEPCSQTQLAERVGARQNDISRAFAKLQETGHLRADRPKGQKVTQYQVADRLFVQWYRMRYLDPGQRSRLAVLADLLADAITSKEKWRYAERFASQGAVDDAKFMAESALQKKGFAINAANIALETLLELRQRLQSGLKNEKPLDLMEMFPSDADMRQAKDEALTVARNCVRFDDEAYSGGTLADLALGSLSLSSPEILRVLRAIPLISRFQWDGFVDVFESEKQEFVELAVRHEEDIQKLKKRHANKWQSPLQDGWEDLSGKGIEREYKEWPKDDVEIVRVAACAVHWLLYFRKSDEFASGGFQGLLHLLDKAADHGWWDESLRILNRLLDALPDKAESAWERAWLLAIQSYVFSRCKRQEQALQSAQKALALISDQVTSTERNNAELDRLRSFAFERTAWALGMFNRWSEAQKNYQEILPLTKGRDSAWNTGQAARYLWRLEGLASAWRLIADQNLEKDDLVFCIGQLGDAVCDTQRVDGIPQAYAAGRELLTDLIERASDPAWKDKLSLESSVRFLFIDMLDTGLDLAVLQDLVQELPGFAPMANELAPLAKVLIRWFDELRNPGAANKNTPPDPDWVTTVAALNEELSFKARLRLGLTKVPRLSSEAASVFTRILAFIK